MSLKPTQSQFPPSLLELRLGHTKITAVDGSMFQEAESINELDLCHTKLTKVSDDAFQSFQNVTRICLSGNPLEVAPRLPASLEILDISETRLQNITRHMLGNLHKVTEAYMNNGEIKWIERCAFENMTSLKKLDLSENKISFLKRNALKIPKPHTSNLLDLNLSSNVIIQVQKGAFKSHRRLQILDLSNNFIDALEQGTLNGLRSLRSLNLGKNTIFEIDGSSFAMLTELQILRLEENYIEYLDADAFHGLKKLEELYLARNGLAVIETLTLPSLVFLDIAENDLLSFPEVRSESVRGIKAMFNPIENLDQDTFSGTPNLQILDLSYCGLANLTFSVFLKVKLQKLNLQNNVLTDFVDVRLPSLEELYLAENKVHGISVQLSEILPNLTALDLRHNDLKFLDPSIFEDLSNVTILDLSGNNFICDCDLIPLVKWMQSRERTVVDADMYLCEGPPEEYAMPVIDAVKALECNSESLPQVDNKTTVIIGVAAFVIVLCLATMIGTLLKRRQKRRTDENENRKDILRKETAKSSNEDSSILCMDCLGGRKKDNVLHSQCEETKDLMDESKQVTVKEASTAV